MKIFKESLLVCFTLNGNTFVVYFNKLVFNPCIIHEGCQYCRQIRLCYYDIVLVEWGVFIFEHIYLNSLKNTFILNLFSGLFRDSTTS